MYNQIIGDNVFAFGFKNVFNWNIMVTNETKDDKYTRMIMFEETQTYNDRLIICTLTEIKEGKTFTSSIKKNINGKILKTLDNPYSENKTIIALDDSTDELIFAFIHHFSYVLNVGYIDKKSHNVEKFIELIKTYSNLKIHF